MKEFEYFKVHKKEEAINLLALLHPDAAILAGGTDLIVRMKDGIENPNFVIDIKGIDYLKKIEFNNGEGLFIGANAILTDIAEDKNIIENYPVLSEAALSVGSFQIRSKVTMVGNICIAVPSADTVPALLNLNASLLIEGKSGERRLPLSEFIKGPRKTVLKSDEIVTGIKIPDINFDYEATYIKYARIEGMDLATSGVAAMIFENEGKLEYRVVVTAVAPTSKRIFELENFLLNKEIKNSLYSEIEKIIKKNIAPISDIRATKKFREKITGVLDKQALQKVFDKFAERRLS